MKRYKVVFEFLNSNGAWVCDDLSDNGKGFNIADAEYIKEDLKLTEIVPIQNVHLELLR